MKHLIWRANVRTLKHHPWQWVLALFGVMMGVAVVVSIDLAESGALRSFERATETLFGRATHRISSPFGLPESLYVALRRAGFAGLKPVLEGVVKAVGSDRRLKLVGVDPVAELRFAPTWLETSANQTISWRRLLLEAGSVLIDRGTGESLGLQSGQTFNVRVGKRQITLKVAGWLASSRRTPESTLIADMATAQETLDALGRLSAIDVMVSGDDELAALKTLMPAGVELSTREAGSVSVRQMTDAFYANLTALSLLALLVGAFLIFNIVGFMTVQRLHLFGILRVLGMTRHEIRNQVLFEAGILGMVGSLLGVAAGILLGGFMLSLLARTLDEVYFPLPSAQLEVSFWCLGKGMLLGVAATLIAAWKPALEAARVQPVTVLLRSVQEQRMVDRRVWTALVGVLMLVAGGISLKLSGTLVSGFVILTAMVFGSALLVPSLLRWIMGGLQSVGGLMFGVAGRMPPRAVVASLSRTGVAAAALMVAIATTIGMTLMIHSFRDSVEGWLKQRLDADLYVYQPGPEASGRTALPRALGKRIAKIEGVAGVGSVRYLRLATDRGFVRINAYELSPSAFATFDLVEKTVADPWQAFQFQPTVMVSEPYANLNHVHAGQWIQLATARGAQKFQVIAVYVDYNAGRGIVSLSRHTYDRFWDDPGVSTFWVYLAPDVDPSVVSRRIRSLFPDGRLEITDNQNLLSLSMGIFDQAFAVTGVLRWLATLVAFVGVFSALLALQLERTHELGILRALGLTPGQLWRLVVTETGLLGAVSGVLAIPVGVLIGWVLTNVVNQRAFGWKLSLSLDWQPLIQGVLLALMAGLAGGVYPAWRMARTSPALALRNE